MLTENSELVYKLRHVQYKNANQETFCDTFEEFIYEVDCLDLSETTKQHLYELFIKDMELYFEFVNKERLDDE